jgi:predicted 3-demethylubiquinone-9 3-methyltransferase (glyoxalase superfamily)
MPKITPFLWFDTQAEEAMNFYASIFKSSNVVSVNRAQGRVMSVAFELEGQPFMALNAGPQYKFSEAVSFLVGCESQQEIDELWARLTEGGAPMRLAEGQVRLVVADRAHSVEPDAERQGRREVEAGHERHAPDRQTRSEAVAAGLRRRLNAG